uniref:Beta-amylase n=1 Tax=Lactuca sativa TaxID=4236 RepID=A0A9R1WIP7_LACSA|nr:hypothetical protein LSAT_V11C100048670 [Lactuca sativa]
MKKNLIFPSILRVGLAFHEYGGNDSISIPLPQWVVEIGKDNKDIFFTDREGRRNTKCLSWGIDKERVLKGRTAAEVYFDVMRSFRTDFDDMFVEGLITGLEIGLDANGELKYPSFSEKWDGGILVLVSSRGPENCGEYNSSPQETGFFCEHGDYGSHYGRFFLQLYSQFLIDHANTILSLATLGFEKIQILVKIPAVYWWYRSKSHASKLTGGYYNPDNHDGYSRLFKVLKKHSVVVKFVCPGSNLNLSSKENHDPEGLTWQVLNSAWEEGLCVAGENAFPCFDREVLMRLLETAKPSNDPDHQHFVFFNYKSPFPILPLFDTTLCFSELDQFFPLVENCIVGFNSSVFAYGQSGSGKTYTIWGPSNALLEEELPSDQQGLTPRVFESLFFFRMNEVRLNKINMLTNNSCINAAVLFLRSIMNKLLILLDPTQRNIQIREDTKTGVYVENLTEESVSSIKDVTKHLKKERTTSPAAFTRATVVVAMIEI